MRRNSSRSASGTLWSWYISRIIDKNSRWCAQSFGVRLFRYSMRCVAGRIQLPNIQILFIIYHEFYSIFFAPPGSMFCLYRLWSPLGPMFCLYRLWSPLGPMFCLYRLWRRQKIPTGQCPVVSLYPRRTFLSIRSVCFAVKRLDTFHLQSIV